VKRIVRIIATLTCTIAAFASTTAFAGGLDNLSTLTQSQYQALAKDIGAAAAYKGVTPGNALGITGVDVGVELTQTKIDNSGLLQKAGGGDSSNLFIPKLHVYKGLPGGFDIGAFVSKISGVDASLFGASLRYQIIEDGLATPSVALRLSGSRITGVSQLGLNTVAVDAIVSKKLTLVTPYAGVGSVRTSASAKVGNLGNADSTASRVFVGLNANFLASNFALEAEKLGSNNSISAKVGFRF
jgi:hypothetical protein